MANNITFLVYQRNPGEFNLFTAINLDELLYEGKLCKVQVEEDLKNKLAKIKKLKNKAVLNQEYELAASYREQERKLNKQLFGPRIPPNFSTTLVLSKDGTDYFFAAPTEVISNLETRWNFQNSSR
jgi:hypothetical protein